MPKEDRFISFDLKEVYQALEVRCRLAEIDLPKADNPLRGELSKDQKVFTLVFAGNDNEAEHAQKFEFTFFVLALVFYCNSKGIPIPKAGKKTMNVQSDAIIMRIQL